MKTFFILQAAQSKKGKAAEKSPAEETAKPIEMAADVKLVKEQIETQGQKVRKMKATGAAKVKQWRTQSSATEQLAKASQSWCCN